MSKTTSDAAVVVLILAAGTFSAVIAARISARATHMLLRRSLIVGVAVLAAAAVAFVLFSLFGYRAVA
jgi:hypothetical protein